MADSNPKDFSISAHEHRGIAMHRNKSRGERVNLPLSERVNLPLTPDRSKASRRRESRKELLAWEER